MEATTTSQRVAVCEGCGSRYRVAADSAGKRLRCKKCGEAIRVPLAAAAERTAASHPTPLRKPAPAAPRPRLVTPRSASAAGSIRERAAQRHVGFRFGPIQVVIVVAVVGVFVLYKMYCK